MSVLVWFTGCAGRHMMKRDNKCFILIFIGISTFTCVCVMSTALYMREVPLWDDFSVVFKKECVRNKGIGVSTDPACDSYFNGDMYNGLYTTWGDRHDKSFKSPFYKAMLQDVQKSYACCGFGTVQGCREDRKLVSTDYPEGQKCGTVPGWYPPTTYCSVMVKFPGEEFEVVGGCPYDLPIGECGIKQPLNYTRGCAEGSQQWLNSKLIPYGAIAFEMGWIQVVTIVVSGVLFWKRKDWDVVPAAKRPKLFKWRKDDVVIVDEDRIEDVESRFSGRTDVPPKSIQTSDHVGPYGGGLVASFMDEAGIKEGEREFDKNNYTKSKGLIDGYQSTKLLPKIDDSNNNSV